MALGTRTINIDLASVLPGALSNVEVTFRPSVIDGGSDELLILASGRITTDNEGDAVINLPVKVSGAIRYQCHIGIGGQFGIFTFDLTAGSAIFLSALLAAGTGTYPQPIYDYIDGKFQQLFVQGIDGGNALTVYTVGGIDGGNAATVY